MKRRAFLGGLLALPLFQLVPAAREDIAMGTVTISISNGPHRFYRPDGAEIAI